MIKSILIDLDGCLVDCVQIHFEALNMALMQIAGFEIKRAEEGDFNGLPTFAKLAKLTKQGRVREEDHKLIWMSKQNHAKEAIVKYLSPDPVKIELHEYTKSLGIRSACVTNSITETTKLMLKCSGQLEYMSFIVTNEMVKIPKPDSEGYLIAIEKMGVPSKECIIIEDAPRGIQAAKGTGAHLMRVTGPADVTKDAVSKFIQAITGI